MSLNQEVSAVAIKLPPFWTTQPEVWFVQCEAQFTLRNVSSQETKFAYIIAALDSSTSAEVASIIIHPPEENKYDALKKELIKAFGKTQEDKDALLLNLSGLGDRTPSALLRHMKALNSDPKTLFRALFLSQLPAEVRRVLSINTTDTLEVLADEADRIMAAGKAFSAINAIDEQQVNHVAAFQKFDQNRKMHSGARRGTQLTWSQNPSLAQAGLNANGICAYHVQFKSDAKRCIPGCQYTRQVKSTVSGNANTNRH